MVPWELARPQPRISSAARSPIMIDGALVLPPVIDGMMAASATRSPSMPRTLSSGSTTAPLVHAHPAGADRVVDGVDVVRQLAPHGGLAEVLRPRPDLARVVPGAGHDLADHRDALHEHFGVLRLAEVSGVDERRHGRVGGREPHGAPALGVDQGREHAAPRALRRRVDADRGVVLVGHRVDPVQLVQLQVGDLARVRRPHEPDGLERRERRPRRPPLEALAREVAEEVVRRRLAQRRRHVERHRHEQVVVQVVAHRQVGLDLDAVLLEVRRGADAREHQDVR